jgi:ubiquinone/menaquinone biosynthesis C-methylase UbiE
MQMHSERNGVTKKKRIEYSRDPESAELKHLVAACQLSGKSVLEIGCGNGVLTWQYAHLPRRVIGIDPKAAELQEASRARPASRSEAFFIQAMGEALPFPPQTFDLVIFASSL